MADLFEEFQASLREQGLDFSDVHDRTGKAGCATSGIPSFFTCNLVHPAFGRCEIHVCNADGIAHWNMWISHAKNGTRGIRVSGARTLSDVLKSFWTIFLPHLQ